VAGEVDGDYIILTEYNPEWSGEDYYVKVDEETLVSTELVSTDAYTGLALIAVNSETLNNAGVSPRVVKMGNSYEARQNEIVIALGRVQDNSEGYATGYITEVTSDSGIDMSLDILKTNVELKVGDYAFVFDINGYLLGIADSESGVTDDEEEHIIGISSLKPLIEKMSTAVPVAYLGIKCTNITKDIAEKFHFPEGIYVTEVELDSPAYKAGIQAGDIIYGIGDEEVVAVQTLSEKILSLNKDDTIKVKIKRTGKGGEYREIEYSAKLAER
jgi:S1-C subfamily serine protease